MKLNFIERTLGSGFYSGYFPIAPGTIGSIFALTIYLIPGMENPTIMLGLISLFTIIGIHVGTTFEKVYGKDPKQCTIDEFVGMWITLLFVPKYILYILFAFIVWRILDIVKPFPVNIIQKLKGGWGIMSDDIIAGLYSLILVHIFIYFIN